MKRILLMAALMLAGCASPEQRAARERAEFEERQAMQRQYRDAMVSRCESYGFVVGNPDFSNCMMQLDQQNRAQGEANRRAAIQAIMTQQQQPAVNPYYIPPPRPIIVPVPQAPRQSQCSWVGQFWTCN